MNILLIEFINILTITGLTLTLYKFRKTFQNAEVLILEKVQKRG